MPSVRFEAIKMASAKSAEAPDGGDLLALCDEILAPVAFSCRSASCGSCHIEILEGSELLEEPEEAEQELLDLLKKVKNSRLACQAQMKAGPGLLRIRAIID